MAQACELPRASDRSSSYAAIASDTSSATFANSAHSPTTSSKNCSITTSCATGNSGNSRRRLKYSPSSRAPQGDWRAVNPGNKITPPSLHLWKFDTVTGAPYGAHSNQYAPSTFGTYARALSVPQQPCIPNNLRQPRPNQHTTPSISATTRATRFVLAFPNKLVRRPSTNGYVR